MDEKLIAAIQRLSAAYTNYPKLEQAYVLARQGIVDAHTALDKANQGVKDAESNYLAARGAYSKGYQEIGDARNAVAEAATQAMPPSPIA